MNIFLQEKTHVKVRPSTQNTTFPIGSVSAGVKDLFSHKVVIGKCRYSYRISYVQAIFWEFEAQESSGDVNDITKFAFSVNEDIHGTRDDFMLKVYTTVDPSIVLEQSYVRVEADQCGPTLTATSVLQVSHDKSRRLQCGPTLSLIICVTRLALPR
ncbi:hypothetical protein PoB_006717100, partial [Plakobranchus ocellatus]